MDAKLWFRSKTVWFNIIAFAVLFLQMVLNTDLIVDPEWVALLTALLNILLRYKTNAPIKIR